MHRGNTWAQSSTFLDRWLNETGLMSVQFSELWTRTRLTISKGSGFLARRRAAHKGGRPFFLQQGSRAEQYPCEEFQDFRLRGPLECSHGTCELLPSFRVEPAVGIEPTTRSLQNCCSAAELSRRCCFDYRSRWTLWCQAREKTSPKELARIRREERAGGK
jgi:hypothetical protein